MFPDVGDRIKLIDKDLNGVLRMFVQWVVVTVMLVTSLCWLLYDGD